MELLIKYLPSLMSVALNKTNNEEDAKDLLQDAAFNVLRHKGRVEKLPAEEQRKFLRMVVNNLHKDSLRRKQAKHNYDIVQPVKYQKPSAPWKLQLDYVLQGLSKINPKYKRAVLLAAEGFNSNEIKDKMSIPLGSALRSVQLGRQAAKSISFA